MFRYTLPHSSINTSNTCITITLKNGQILNEGFSCVKAVVLIEEVQSRTGGETHTHILTSAQHHGCLSRCVYII